MICWSVGWCDVHQIAAGDASSRLQPWMLVSWAVWCLGRQRLRSSRQHQQHWHMAAVQQVIKTVQTRHVPIHAMPPAHSPHTHTEAKHSRKTQSVRTRCSSIKQTLPTLVPCGYHSNVPPTLVQHTHMPRKIAVIVLGGLEPKQSSTIEEGLSGQHISDTHTNLAGYTTKTEAIDNTMPQSTHIAPAYAW